MGGGGCGGTQHAGQGQAGFLTFYGPLTSPLIGTVPFPHITSHHITSHRHLPHITSPHLAGIWEAEECLCRHSRGGDQVLIRCAACMHPAVAHGTAGGGPRPPSHKSSAGEMGGARTSSTQILSLPRVLVLKSQGLPSHAAPTPSLTHTHTTPPLSLASPLPCLPPIHTITPFS